MKQVVTFAVALLFFTGCANLGLQTRKGLSEEEQRQQVNQQVNTLQKSSLDTESRLQELESSVRNLQGKAESNEHKISLVQKAARTDVDAINSKNNAQEEKLKAYQESILHLEQVVASQQVQINDLKTALSNAMATQQAQAQAEKSKSRGEKEIFEDAEKLFEKKNYKKAILSYQAYRDAYPKGKLYASATYKMGVAFLEDGSKSEAKLFLSEVIEKFPKSEFAKKAKEKLKHLK